MTPADLETRLAKLPTVGELALADSEPEMAAIAVQGVRHGLQQSVDVNGKPFAPLKRPRLTGGNKPLSASGALGESVRATASNGELTIEASGPGASILLTGGTIRPVNAKYLATPVTLAALQAGSPRNYPNQLFFMGRRGGKSGVLAEKSGKQNVKVQYALVKSVTIPEREYIGLSDQSLDAVLDVVTEKALDRVMKMLE